MRDLNVRKRVGHRAAVLTRGKSAAGPQNSSDPEVSEARLHHLQGPNVFARRGGHTERAHLAGDRGAGGGPENR